MSKRIKALALMLAVAIVLAIVPVNNVQAASSTKQSTISANSQITDKLTDSVDAIWYSFTAPADGCFTVSVAKKNVTDDPRYRVKLVDSTGSKVFLEQTGNTVTLPAYGTKAGQKYYIVVENDWYAKDVYFNVKVNWSNSGVWESEPNDTQAGAKPMAINTAYYGSPVNEDGGDYFSVKAPQNGYFVFNLSHNDVTETGDYDLFVLDSGAAEITHIDGKLLTTIKIGVKAGTTLFAKVENDWAAKNQVYKLVANFTPSDSFETEPNNSAAEAKVVAFDKVYTGSIGNWNKDDADYYKFSVNSISQVSIVFGPVDISQKGTWNVDIINSKGKTADLVSTESTKTTKVKLSKGTYYIKVMNSWGASNKEYQLKVSSKALNFKSKRPVIKTASVKKNNGIFNNKKFVGCSLSKTVSGADGYEVAVASTKAMRKPFVKEKLKGGKKLKTEKYFNSKQKYFYVQVRPYFEDPFGTVVYGKKSVAKKVATKAK